MNNAQTHQALLGFAGQHGRAVVTHERARQAALLKGLAGTVAEFLGALGQIPLGMASQAAMIIEDAQQDRIGPATVVQQDRQRAVMKVQVPEAVDIFVFVTAHLAALEAVLGRLGARAVDRATAWAFAQAVGFHKAQDRGIRRLGPQVGLLLHQHQQVVGVELIAPVGMLPILGGQRLPEIEAQRRMLAGVGAELAPQGCHRILLFMERGVKPAFDRGEAEADPLSGDRVTPLLSG